MKLNLNNRARALVCAGIVASVALLAACGGGEQEQTFYPNRVLAFGDEFSVINADQSKYTVNALTSGSSTAYDCTSNPLWIQTVAANYGLVFPQCNSSGTTDPISRIYAAYGAKVEDLSAQIDQQLSEGGFSDKDLVTILVGANDVVAQFQQYPSVGEVELTTNLVAAGTALAQQVNRVAGYGAKVLIVTIPDMGLTPFAGDRSTGSTDSNPALLTRLSTKFNDALLANLLNDGHKIGLVQLDEYLKAVDTTYIQGYTGTYTNTTLVTCTVALPKCTTDTVVADAVNAVWLWADNRHIGATAQAALGTLALSRATNNPF